MCLLFMNLRHFNLICLSWMKKKYLFHSIRSTIQKSFFFFTNLMHKFFFPYIYYIPLHASSTIVLIFRSIIVLTQHLVSSLSLGDSRHLCTEQSPKESDDTRCCVNTIVLLKMSTVVLETCKGMYRNVINVLK